MSKVAIVTGAGQGIGFAIAKRLCKMALRSEYWTTMLKQLKKQLLSYQQIMLLRSLLMYPNKQKWLQLSKRLLTILEI